MSVFSIRRAGDIRSR